MNKALTERRGLIDVSDDLSPILDQLRVIWVALHGTGVLSDDMITAAANVLNGAANDLEGVIDRLNAWVKERGE